MIDTLCRRIVGCAICAAALIWLLWPPQGLTGRELALDMTIFTGLLVAIRWSTASLIPLKGWAACLGAGLVLLSFGQAMPDAWRDAWTIGAGVFCVPFLKTWPATGGGSRSLSPWPRRLGLWVGVSLRARPGRRAVG